MQILTNPHLDYILSLYLHACKILRWLEINNYLIYKMFKILLFILQIMQNMNLSIEYQIILNWHEIWYAY